MFVPKLDDVIDLVIPRGSNKLVSQIKASTKIPVLGHAGKCYFMLIHKIHQLHNIGQIIMNSTYFDAMTSFFLDGICHVYVDKSANVDMAKQIVVDAKTDYPAACNAMVCLILHYYGTFEL